MQRTLNGVITYYVYDGEKPILEYKSTGAMAGNNVYGKGINEILMRGDYVVAPSGQGYFYQQDGNGNVTHLTSFQGTVIEQYKYDAFGAPTTTYSGGVFNNRFKFTGREWAERFGFYEYRARAYHPTLGRFMSEDPSGFAGGDYNLFGYCGNDPLNEVDPMGLQAGHIRLRPPPSGYEMDDGFLGKKIAQARAVTEPGRTYSDGPPAAGKARVNWRDTGDRNMQRDHVRSDSGKSLGARTYPELSISASSDAYGKLDTLNVELKIDVAYAKMINGRTISSADLTRIKRLEPDHYNEIHAWGLDSGRGIAKGIARDYSGRSVHSAINAAKAALVPEFTQAVRDSHNAHDLPWIGNHRY